MKKSNLVAIGLRAKTGRAIAVVLGGAPDAPVVIRKYEIKLTDTEVPATSQPYHVVMDLPWAESEKAARKSVRAIEVVARKALAGLSRELRSAGLNVYGVATVGAPDRDLSKIGNPHIRAHAAEGILFRKALDLAAEANDLKCRSFSDRQFDQSVATELGDANEPVRNRLSELRRQLPPPWRTDEKQAAMAAWLMLHG
jgi:hypothetical protein